MSIYADISKPWWEPPAALRRSMDEGARKLAAARAALEEHRAVVDKANRDLADKLRRIGGLTTSEHANLLAWIEDGCDVGAVQQADPIVNLLDLLRRQSEGECCDE
jgi:hypothetical protein